MVIAGQNDSGPAGGLQAGSVQEEGRGDLKARARVLIVTEPDEAAHLARALESTYEVEASNAPRDVIERLRRSAAEVLIVDAGLPEIDVPTLLRDLRADPHIEDTAVIALAEAAREEVAVAALQAGANDHLLKPFSLEALLARVGYALAVARTCRELARTRDELMHVRETSQNASLDELESLRERATRTEELDRSRRDFINLAAHELRSPLTVVGGYISMLEDGAFGPVVSDELRQVLPVITEKLAEMERLVTEMLETARLEEQTPDLAVSLIDLREVVEGCVRALGPRWGGSERIRLELEHRPLLVAGERPRVVTIVRNLIDNALKFSPEGGNVRITGDVDQVLHRAALAISDCGIGIAPQDQPRLFQRFGRITTDASRDIHGTGLGLYLSRQLARLHGGDITMQSNSEGGSTFTLWLPLAGPRPGVTALGGDAEVGDGEADTG